MDEAAARAVTRVYWHTQETNHVARSLYDAVAHHAGFVVYRHDLPQAPRQAGARGRTQQGLPPA
jgi:hypothetical protein